MKSFLLLGPKKTRKSKSHFRNPESNDKLQTREISSDLKNCYRTSSCQVTFIKSNAARESFTRNTAKIWNQAPIARKEAKTLAQAGLATLLERVNLFEKSFKVKKYLKIQIWCNLSCKVGNEVII